MTNENEQIELIPYQDNIWWELLEQTKGLDYQLAKPHGWHWFWGLDYLYNKMQDILSFDAEKMKNAAFFDVKTVQNELPDGHWLKQLDSTELKNIYDSGEHKILVETLKEIFKEGDTIVHLIDFSKLRFDNSADFSDLIFPFDVSFEHTAFSDGVVFNGAIFCRQGNFIKTQFSGDVFFNKAKFVGLGNFYEANFINGVSFNRTSFSMIANFQKAKFSEMADFFKANISRNAIFREATFATLANFGNADISGNTNFIDTHFETRAPYLHDAKIGTGILWDKNVNRWPQTRQDRDNETDSEYKNRIANNQNDYEVLVSHMQKLDKHDDEHFFFRQEMRWRRLDNKLTQHPSKKYFNWKPIEDNLNIFFFRLYEIFADYGYGIGRAFAWWAGHIVLGAVILFAIRSVDRWNMSWEDFGCSLGISLSNSHGFFFMGDRLDNCYGVFKDLPFFTAIWVTQTVFGVLLLFLFLLTLRIRFRLK